MEEHATRFPVRPGRARCLAALAATLLGSPALLPAQTLQGSTTSVFTAGRTRGALESDDDTWSKEFADAAPGRQGKASSGEIGPKAGTSDDVASPPGYLQVKTLTRYERAKEQLRDLTKAYIDRHMSGFQKGFSSDSRQDLSVLWNAVQSDWNNETDINIDIELQQYWMTFERVCMRARWNRTSKLTTVDPGLTGGQSTNETGTGVWCFDRFEDFKMRMMSGSVPFGRSDPAWRQQVASGDPNPDEGLTPQASVSEGPQMPALMPVTLNLDRTPGGLGNLAAIDFEAKTVRKVESSSPTSEAALPGEDLHVYVRLNVAPTVIFFRAVNSAKVMNCGTASSTLLSSLRGIDETKLVSSTTDSVGPNFGIRTDDAVGANFVLFRVSDLAVSTFMINEVPLVNPVGDVDCLGS